MTRLGTVCPTATAFTLLVNGRGWPVGDTVTYPAPPVHVRAWGWNATAVTPVRGDAGDAHEADGPGLARSDEPARRSRLPGVERGWVRAACTRTHRGQRARRLPARRRLPVVARHAGRARWCRAACRTRRGRSLRAARCRRWAAPSRRGRRGRPRRRWGRVRDDVVDRRTAAHVVEGVLAAARDGTRAARSHRPAAHRRCSP